jgi:SAM-dependent methyltransferase
VPFWRRVAGQAAGPVLELGCGTGRISLPLARAGISMVGIDRSAPMLERAAKRRRRLKPAARQPRNAGGRLQLVRGDIRHLPFATGSFAMVLAPYGILQSLLSDAALAATLSAVARVLAPGGVFGIDLVPDVPNWREYRDRVQHRGTAGQGVHLTLVESVTQDRKRRLTIFQQRYREKRGRQVREHQFDLTFRTLPVRGMIRRLERAGFTLETALGDYRGSPWDERADVWILLARRAPGAGPPGRPL